MTFKPAKPNKFNTAKTRSVLGNIPGLDLREVALIDPILALALYESRDKLPQLFPLVAQLNTGAIDEFTDASTGDRDGFCSDTIILGSKFQVRRIAAFAGSIFKGQSDVNNALNSGIDVNLQVSGECPVFDIMGGDFAPIECVSDAPGTCDTGLGFPYGFVAPRCGRIFAQFFNRRPLAPSEGPVTIHMVFRGISLGNCLQTIELPHAVAELARLGITQRVLVG